ncbi:pyridoxamine 5'-phosphate oxidase family protein [Sulfurimonas sp. HSL-1716]|uniref:pyridoxamine 5'-phosphate oxidase family protein n=1 Tax=Hydrocurvibacter sulfurireducens TaxID=3131937 RepID=UPI0031F9C95C
MRRDEFEVNDPAVVRKLLKECDYGVLSLMSDNEPYGVAVNFVAYEDMICFHGAYEGRKADAIKTHPFASFLAVSPQALIPSYFSDTKSACAATQFYISVMIEGEISFTEDSSFKAGALEAMMQKFQPEGGYIPLHTEDPAYTKMLERTAIYVLKPRKTSLKVKIGQNRSKEMQQRILKNLRERGEAADLETIALMEKYL